MLKHKILTVALLISTHITVTMSDQSDKILEVNYIKKNEHQMTLSFPLPSHKLLKRVMWTGGAISSIGISLHSKELMPEAFKFAHESPQASLIAILLSATIGGAAGNALLCAKKAYCVPQATIKKKQAALGVGKMASGTALFAISTSLNSLDDSMATDLLVRGGRLGGLACIADGVIDIYNAIE